MHVNDGVLFVLYVAGFVVLPGCALYVALVRPARFGMRELGIGWGLGYAVEVLDFGATAWLGVRELFELVPGHRHRADGPRVVAVDPQLAASSGAGASWTWGLALVVIVTVAYTVEGFFTGAPLPWEATVVSYHQDTVWNIAMAAEALHHWPLEVPSLAGIPLRYHWFANVDAAAVSQVTGLPLSLVMLRLALIPMLILVAIQFVGLARTLRASAWAGVAGAALLLLASFADPVPTLPSETLTTFFFSPSFLYGMVVFLALVIVVCDRMAGGRDGRQRQWGSAILVLLLMAGCAGGKTTILPVVAGASLLCLALWCLRRLRRTDHAPRVLLGTLAAAIVVSALFAVTMYSGGSNTPQGERARVVRGGAALRPAAPRVRALPRRPGIDRYRGRDGARPAQAAARPAAGHRGPLRAPSRRRPASAAARDAAARASRRSSCSRIRAAASTTSSTTATPRPRRSAASAWRSCSGPRSGASPGAPAGSSSAVVMLALAAAVESPIDDSPRKTWQALDGQVTYSQVNSNLTRPLYDGLRWVAGNTPTSAVVAVNNRFQDPQRGDPHYCYFTAFAERRAFVECAYDGTSSYYGSLHKDLSRLALNDRIFTAADRAALRTAVRVFGVRYLLIDRVHGPVDERVLKLGEVVFANEALTVVRVPPGG